MAKQGKFYYLLNGSESNSSALYIPYKDSYIKSAKDISDIDIATIELGTGLADALKEVNPNVLMHGQNYVAKYPFAKGIKMFKPIEIFAETNKSIKIVNGFRELAEERQYHSNNGDKLEFDDKLKVEALIDDIMGQLTPLQIKKSFTSPSIIGREIQKDFTENEYRFKLKMSNYTQLRCLLINYLYFIAGKNIPDGRSLSTMSRSIDKMYGLTPEEPGDIKKALEEYKQKLLEAKNEEEKEKAIEVLPKQENNTQMNIGDFIPELAPMMAEIEKNNNIKKRTRTKKRK